ncbi:MAG: heme-binding domain-containing protein [Bacteroidetes bacterium]|nr:heme-binding domain-containing protein [Bacteroidota bacterium]
MLKKIAWILLALLVVIQFFRPKENKSEAAPAHSIAAVYPVPDSVRQILSVACNDCHSNNTRYPWYNRIQPVAWWLAGHVNDGKRDLNFDEFQTYTPRRQYNKLKSLEHEIADGEMPLGSYTIIHKDAILSQEQKKILTYWSQGIRRQMESVYPPDSLARKTPVKGL